MAHWGNSALYGNTYFNVLRTSTRTMPVRCPKINVLIIPARSDTVTNCHDTQNTLHASYSDAHADDRAWMVLYA
jgi:hypothetical protein